MTEFIPDLLAQPVTDIHYWRERALQVMIIRNACINQNSTVEVTRLHQRVAFDLRCGRMAIAHLKDEVYVVVTERGARKLLEVAPERVMFFVHETTGISDPSEQFLRPDWEASLGPHRLSDASTGDGSS